MRTLLLIAVLLMSVNVNAATFKDACITYKPLDLKKLTILDGTIVESAKDRRKKTIKQLEEQLCKCAEFQFSTGMFTYLKNHKFNGNEETAWKESNKFMKNTDFKPDTIKNFFTQNPDALHGCVKELAKN